MKKTLLSLIAVLLTGLSLYSQVSIIPKPNSVITGEGAFVLDRSTSIISNDKNQSDLNYLKEKLVKATGFQFTVTNNLQPKNYIYLDMSAGYQIPDEVIFLQYQQMPLLLKPLLLPEYFTAYSLFFSSFRQQSTPEEQPGTKYGKFRQLQSKTRPGFTTEV